MKNKPQRHKEDNVFRVSTVEISWVNVVIDAVELPRIG